MNNRITYQLTIDESGIFFNDEECTSLTKIVKIDEDLTKLYKDLKIDYPKFYKMDNLSKLGFLGVELLLGKIKISNYKEDEIALVFQNSFASLDTDAVHQSKINTHNDQPSPAIFVYTLPNIVVGEIAIRNKWFGENLFALTDSFDMRKWQGSVDSLFIMNKAKAVIGGWIEVFGNQFELKLFFCQE